MNSFSEYFLFFFECDNNTLDAGERHQIIESVIETMKGILIMKKFGKLILLLSSCITVFSLVSFADATFSDNWVQAADGSWKVKDAQNNDITDAWVCDDAVAANGKDIWYLLDKDGNMVSAGLVQDGTGNYYSLETNHNGYYGMLRYKSGNYDGIDLDLESDHNGSFAAIKNKEAIEALKAKYGLKVVDIDNFNIVYTSNLVRSDLGNNGWVHYGSGDSYYYQNGTPLTGWQCISGKYYYFSPTSGVLYKSRYTPDGYYVNSEGIWNGKDAKTEEQQNEAEVYNDDSEEITDPEDPNYEAPAIWDTTAKTNLVNYSSKASNYMAQAASLIAEAQKLTDRRAAVKKYYNAFGKASGALEQMNYMKNVIEERPTLKLSSGTDALTAIKAAIKNVESFDNFEIEDTTDITSTGFKNKIAKITDAANTVNLILTTAQNMNAVANDTSNRMVDR